MSKKVNVILPKKQFQIQQAKVVRKIFNWYLNGKSIIGIVKELEKENIKSPTGKINGQRETLKPY